MSYIIFFIRRCRLLKSIWWVILYYLFGDAPHWRGLLTSHGIKSCFQTLQTKKRMNSEFSFDIFESPRSFWFLHRAFFRVNLFVTSQNVHNLWTHTYNFKLVTRLWHAHYYRILTILSSITHSWLNIWVINCHSK